MKRAYMLLILCSCLSFIGASAQDITVYETISLAKVLPIPITTDWTDTGVNLVVGDTVNVKCDGIASTNGGLSAYWIGPEGGYGIHPGLPVSDAPVYSVIGRIGTNGTPFYVGRVCAFKANVAGELYLGYNDGVFADNYGYYIAYIFKSSR